jgi:ketopantoate hydroxymethyltransferase
MASLAEALWNARATGGVIAVEAARHTEFKPRFLRQYLNLNEQVTTAVQQYISDVKGKSFPNENEQY